MGYFGADKDMRAITPADADDWAAWLRSDERLSENTTRKRCQFAKSFFAVAVKRKLLPENPLVGLMGAVVSVPERQHFIPRETIDALLGECHGVEYRLLLVMARYMGVRVPSEIVPLKWGHVNWATMRITITSPKTKRHAGGDKRICPIFPEVASILREAWEAAPEGAQWIFPSIRSKEKNLRTWLERAILRTGRKPWPRLWQNFRASRATELADQFPSHVSASWLGHTERIADRHYRQTTETHYDQAISEPTGAIQGEEKVGTETGTETARIGPHGEESQTRKTLDTKHYGPIRYGTKQPSGGQGTRTLNRQAGT